MIVHQSIEQGSPEWHALRYGKIGGSSLKHLMSNDGKPVRNNAIYSEILAAQFEPFVYEEGFKSKEMERGNMLEPLARLAYEDTFGVEVLQIGFAEYSDYAGVSPDGLIGSSEALEIKCPSANTHVKYMLNPMDMIEEYLWQCV
ncbi:MAG: YqaJ viral recombinase family protein, partial [Culicoidibacterales bacterium]